ncbi:MAG: ABC transporter ATP-binding protein [Armatimonadota bacterium]|nr:ABC transporter ATP-binding protein [Armatimonadota bacterium]MDR7403380.1 ABC transporter ATP-binding protein [Armatimonadota bacterium]
MRVVEARDVHKVFGAVSALRGVTLDVADGESVVIFGPNGAGKTTFLKIAATLMRPTAGRVRLFGEDPADNPRLRRHLGLVSHHSYLYGALSGLENLVFAARGYGVADPWGRAEALLDAVGLWGRRHDPVRTYSHGMVRRLSIARALVHDPPLLLLDEPFVGLDRAAADLLVGLLTRMRSSRTVVLTTHSIEQGLALADRVVILVDGRVAYQAPNGFPDRQAAERLYAELVGAQT